MSQITVIGLTLQKLDTILSGKLDEVVDALVLYDQTQKIRRIKQIMKLAQLFSDFEEELIRQGEEAESLSFVYRILKNLSFTDFVFASSRK